MSNRSKLPAVVVMLAALALSGCGKASDTTSVVIPDGGADGGATSAPVSAGATDAATGTAPGPSGKSGSGALGGALASALAGAGGSGAPSGASSGAAPASFTVIAPPADSGGAFDLPSGNLGCAVQPDGVRCDILQRTWKPTPKPASCEFDWGQGMVVGPNGADYSCISDTLIGSGPKVAYGTLVKGSNYACEVTAAGVNCYSLTTHHGFRLSRTAAQVY